MSPHQAKGYEDSPEPKLPDQNGRNLWRSLWTALSRNPGKYAAGSAIDEPFMLLAVEEEQIRDTYRVSEKPTRTEDWP